jgi:hypothetical protein
MLARVTTGGSKSTQTKAHGIVTTEELIVVATSLGLAAFRFTTTAAAAVLHQR